MQNPSIVRAPLVAGLVVLTVQAAGAQPITPLEFKCMAKTATAGSKFVASKLKCVAKCWYEYWHSGSMASYADCLPPYGGVTAQCIDDTVFGLKGAENKFSIAIVKACTPPPTSQCPECYSGGDCTAEAASRVANDESQVDSFVPAIYCERASAMPQEQWCQRGVAVAISKQVAAEQKCYAKCEQNAFKGLILSSACLPPASDGTTQACLAAAELKSRTYIDGKCNDAEVPHSVPECDDAGTYPDGTGWANLVSVWVSGTIPESYCGSPSGAFVD